jgi:hypothetical protein
MIVATDTITAFISKNMSMSKNMNASSSTMADNDNNITLLLLGIQALRLLIPSLGLFFILCQIIQVGLRALFARLQASSFLESRSGYQAIPDAGESLNGVNPTSTGRLSLPPDEHGILPVVVPVKGPRRALIYTLFSLAVFTYLIDGVLLIAHSLISMHWESTTPNPSTSIYRYEEYYILGSSVALTLQTLCMAWQERSLGFGKFKRTYPIVMVLCMWAAEVTLIALLARYIVCIKPSNPPSISLPERIKISGWTIGHLVVQGTRILILSLLLLSFTSIMQRTDYKPNEYQAILAESEAEAAAAESTAEIQGNGGTSTPSRAIGYGTFGGPAGPGGLKKATGPNGQQKSDNAPLQKQKNMSFFERIKILGPHLWPKKSRTLQVVACE